ncbi:MAG: Xaa-Pro peptidase family protein [Spirochaetia bacterium]|nr:Xaa-Pro peptidase family protein [Spirochaetia bacterium]
MFHIVSSSAEDKQLQSSAHKLGFEGILICSRGGGTFDRYAGGAYFANHYQQRCYLPDNLPLWSGRSHSLLLIPSSGEPVLLASTLEFRQDLISLKDVRYGDDFYELFARTAQEKEMDAGRIGIIGEDVLPVSMYRRMQEGLPRLELIPCEHLFEEMRSIKSPREIESIESASWIGSAALEMIMNGVQPGKTESEVIAPAIAYCIEQGAALYFVVTSSGPYSDAVHSIDFPGYDSIRKLEAGELFKVDLIISYEGYISDFGRTTVVGATAPRAAAGSTVEPEAKTKATAGVQAQAEAGPSPLQRKMIETVTSACEDIISIIRPGIKVNELFHRGNEYLEAHDISLDSVQDETGTIYAAFPPHWGHGLGLTWEQPWIVENEKAVLQEGMYMAVEKALYSPGVGTVTYEQNVLITKEGCRTLSTSRKLWI